MKPICPLTNPYTKQNLFLYLENWNHVICLKRESGSVLQAAFFGSLRQVLLGFEDLKIEPFYAIKNIIEAYSKLTKTSVEIDFNDKTLEEIGIIMDKIFETSFFKQSNLPICQRFFANEVQND